MSSSVARAGITMAARRLRSAGVKVRGVISASIDQDAPPEAA